MARGRGGLTEEVRRCVTRVVETVNRRVVPESHGIAGNDFSSTERFESYG